MGKDKRWRFCVAGNIVKTHVDEEGITRYGTKAFVGGTKVYLEGKYFYEGQKRVLVIGHNRFGRYALEWIPLELIENIRVQQVFKPTVLKIMDWTEEIEQYGWYGRTGEDKRAAKDLVERLQKGKE